jgi:hypothetical protein
MLNEFVFLWFVAQTATFSCQGFNPEFESRMVDGVTPITSLEQCIQRKHEIVDEQISNGHKEYAVMTSRCILAKDSVSYNEIYNSGLGIHNMWYKKNCEANPEFNPK